jgi:hypothetical protein
MGKSLIHSQTSSFRKMTDFVWTDYSRGFRGGEFTSDPIVVFDEDGETCTLAFTVKEYTSEETDFFGVETAKWYLEVEIVDKKKIGDLQEYETAVLWGLGDDFSRADFAKEFAEFVLQSYKTHQSLAIMPVAVLDGYQ